MTFQVFICGTARDRARCSSHDCVNRAPLVCEFAVKRNGEPATCGRAVCQGCAVQHEGKTLCAAHGRVAKARKP